MVARCTQSLCLNIEHAKYICVHCSIFFHIYLRSKQFIDDENHADILCFCFLFKIIE